MILYVYDTFMIRTTVRVSVRLQLRVPIAMLLLKP